MIHLFAEHAFNKCKQYFNTTFETLWPAKQRLALRFRQFNSHAHYAENTFIVRFSTARRLEKRTDYDS